MLKLQDIRQGDDYDCGSVAIDVVCALNGRALRGPVSLANRVQGMDPATVEAILRALNFKVLSGALTLEDLQHLSRTRAVICPISRHGGHWVVVAGVWRGKVHVQCPQDGPIAIKTVDWEAEWKDTSRNGHPFHNWGLCAWSHES